MATVLQKEGGDMENLVEQGMLYDFYGPLLTPHQQKIYEMVVYQDLSCGEIAEQTGVSRQAVSDLIRRVSAQLEDYEQRLGLAGRFRSLRRCCDELDAAAQRLSTGETSAGEEAGIIRRCSDRIRKEL